jgi:hypothetical protein
MGEVSDSDESSDGDDLSSTNSTVTDRTPGDCEHTKSLITVDRGDEDYEKICIVCNEYGTITLDNDN